MFHSTMNISAEAAFRLIELAHAHAAANGWSVAAVVVDAQGIQLASLRMDGVAPPVLEFATDKAFTAATMRRPTMAFFDRMDSSDRLRMGAASRPRLLVWGGGLPIVHESRILGGIGVSGAAEDEDVACARIALEALGFGSEP